MIQNLNCSNVRLLTTLALLLSLLYLVDFILISGEQLYRSATERKNKHTNILVSTGTLHQIPYLCNEIQYLILKCSINSVPLHPT
jgi:hypothetical protein